MLSFGQASDALKEDEAINLDFYQLCADKILPIIKFSMMSVR
jgi:hypothetical protein